MKTFIFTMSFLLVNILLFSQSKTYKSFEVELMTGLFTSNQKIGMSGGLEMRYNFNDKIALGIKYESIALVNKDEIDTSSDEVEIESIYGLQNFAITGEYYLINGKKKKKVFAGLTLGLYNARHVLVDNDTSTNLGTKFGVAPRIGAELGWFRPALKYHIIPKFGEESLSSFDLSLGIVFGGGRR